MDTAHREPAPIERDEPRLGAIILVGIALVGIVVATLFGMRAFGHVLDDRVRRDDREPSPFVDERPPTPEPRLQESPNADLRTLRAHEDAILSGIAVIDSEAGLYRIPIDAAMDRIAERGLPVREEGPK